MKIEHTNARRTSRRLLTCGLGLAMIAAMTAGAPEVEARGVTPLDGKAWWHSDADCFINNWSMLENQCNTPRKWLFDAPIDTSGNVHNNLSIYGRGTGTSVVKCWIVSTTDTGVLHMSVYGERGQATYGALALNQYEISIPAHGNLHVDCDLPAFTGGTKGGISAFHYDQ
ncbi:hypothetical protein [Paraliomyxa miuraensis]|uniref:hypothetical protein n=1 Tax=Paraliomyxa miuraensis TaxID=376150 RepID=UPI00225801DF|nr:hypothetical protein [Paraliomyxa miuraensis]MCX4241209.1 hypothetical protein [Paraliomyxa miuraensis]